MESGKQGDGRYIFGTQFNDVIDNYYDTEFADESRISIIFFYLLQNKKDDANAYYEANKNKFLDINKEEEAKVLLTNYSESSNWFKNKIRLYK